MRWWWVRNRERRKTMVWLTKPGYSASRPGGTRSLRGSPHYVPRREPQRHGTTIRNPHHEIRVKKDEPRPGVMRCHQGKPCPMPLLPGTRRGPSDVRTSTSTAAMLIGERKVASSWDGCELSASRVRRHTRSRVLRSRRFSAWSNRVQERLVSIPSMPTGVSHSAAWPLANRWMRP